MYRALRPLLFALDPELAHGIGMAGLRLAHCLHFGVKDKPIPAVQPTSCMGLTFSNPVGLAAGLDKNAEAVDALGSIGFGFVEVGTVTPCSQPGNPRPRLFRLPEAGAIINRMGFNNCGVEGAVERLRRRRFEGVLGVNIGKNATTPLERAGEDYAVCIQAAYSVADYLTVNISSPNTEGLRSLQGEAWLPRLLNAICDARSAASEIHQREVPFLVKISPDLDFLGMQRLADMVLESGMDGLVAVNTTLGRSRVEGRKSAEEDGGLSGIPLLERALDTVSLLRRHVGPSVPLIGVGGIQSPSDAQTMRDAGASLIQVYTGLIYQGVSLIPSLVRALDEYIPEVTCGEG